MLLYAGARSVGRAFRHRLTGAYEARMRCVRSGQHLSRHRVSGAYELRKRVRPDGAALFLHRPSGVRELPQAGSPFPGGKVFAEPQRGIRRLRTAGASRRPPRWAKRKDNLRFSFLFELLPFPWIVWRRLPICDRCEIGERQSGYCSVTFSAFSQFTDSVLLHIRATLRWVRHNSAARFVSALLRTVSAKINCTKRLIRRCHP